MDLPMRAILHARLYTARIEGASGFAPHGRTSSPMAPQLYQYKLVSLKQGSETVEQYLDRFECALTRLNLPIQHALSIFLTNLNPHLAFHVQQFNVTTVSEAARIAKLHDFAIQQTPAKVSRPPFNPYSKQPSQFHKSPNSAALLPTPEQPKPPATSFKAVVPFKQNSDRPPRRFSYTEMQERRTKGLCMFCDDVYTPEHGLKHKKSHIYIMEGEEDASSDSEEPDHGVEGGTAEDANDTTPTISVNALNGAATFNCMRVVGQYAKRRLYILIDPGSTHNFIDLAVAKELGCKLEQVRPMSVTAANGNNMLSSYCCRDFSWRLQGYEFRTEVRTLPLDCCDLVLGVQWLSTLGPIWWDFSNLRMEFSLLGVKHVLRGSVKSGCKVITGGSLNKLLVQEPQVLFLQVREITDIADSADFEPAALFSHISATAVSAPPDLQRLLDRYDDLFAAPSELPPFRAGFDHRIPLQSVHAWSSYLTHRPFLIRTDQKSLKYLLEQKVSTPFQHLWLSKLMGYTFEIHYKQGKENVAADALSRVTGSQLLAIFMSHACPDLFDKIQLLWQSDANLKKLISDLQEDPALHPSYSYSNNELRHRNKLVVGNDPAVKTSIFQWLHDSVVGGHSGRDATLQHIKSLFFWPCMTTEVQTYVRNCTICQKNNLDFIEGLPPSFCKHCILVVVDRLSKNAHFLALSHPYTALDVAQTYLDNVFKLHGMPHSLISDRDPTFLSEVWKELFRVHGVDLRFSSAYHPQSDGQTEVTNKTLETYLRCMTADAPHTWSRWLPLAEWWYNTTFHSSARSTPYEILYGQPPPLHLPYLPGESSLAVVDRSLRKREELLELLKFRLHRAQNRQKQADDARRSAREFQVGDHVYLKLQPYRQQSLKNRKIPHKLSPRFYGPFLVTDRVGSVAYKLQLPATAAIHNVFHVSQLKLCPNPSSSTSDLPQFLLDVGTTKEPEAILERKMVNRQNKAATKVLVHWKGETPDMATWEFYADFIAKYPAFHP
ncbi:hypothetical protein V2J09_017609 [Rumex salicifolius]